MPRNIPDAAAQGTDSATLHGQHCDYPGCDVTSGGRVAAGGDYPAFTFAAPKVMPLPVIIAAPHAGRAYFPALTHQMRDPRTCQLRLEDRHVDALAKTVAERIQSGLLVAHAPRAMLDLNRAESDVDWDMIDGPRQTKPIRLAVPTSSHHRSRSGLGLVPRRLPGFGEVWRARLPRAELDRRIEDIHQPYHHALGRELQRIRDLWGAALLIDLHSMPPLEVCDAEGAVPVMVLGDRFGASCHHSLMTTGLNFLSANALAAAQNRPYAGGYVLDRHGAPDHGIHAIQVEVCRSLYLDADLAELTREARDIANVLAGLALELGRQTALLGEGRAMLEAAE
ncbi:MAG: N-formylglutamate amidohydrolase [Erythrobacter sp.]